MADLVIRGMEMPKDWDLWLCIDTGGTVYNVKPVITGTAQEVGTAIPLPEGHGKLIDIEDVKSEKFHIEGRAEMYSAYNIGWNDALDAVCMNASPIVPAEGGTDDV